MRRGDIPYIHLGKELRRIRTSLSESTAEVSGAVEIDMERLDQFERGEDRPSEDILLLLITHFGIKEDAAAQLWELAGYHAKQENDQKLEHQQAITILPLDSRVVYTDMLHIKANKHGLVMNFKQESMDGGQPLTVARVGMSMGHARNVLEILTKAIEDSTGPKTIKALPAPKKSEKDKK